MIASDSLVLCVTWYRTYGTAKPTLHSLGKKTFASILFLDGTTCFLLLLLSNVLRMTFTLVDSEHNAVINDPLTAAAVLERSLSPIFTSRFLIDLQKAQRKLEASSRSVSLGELAF
ncbi:hypothetical protein BD311DRAFT_758659 [Dichomitus squalens]|uniref:Uncharacterized protein n=1 Tax=Dichomitus squalens TaxID=114155 RepID=A0A4Q9MKW3_9APHY|nr:hypothetical protein BD311DRAFT_758659 [Dichomitus squalens]